MISMKLHDFREKWKTSQKRVPFAPPRENTYETYAFLMVLGTIFRKNRIFRKKGKISGNFTHFADFHQISPNLVIFTKFWCFGGQGPPELCNFVEMLTF